MYTGKHRIRQGRRRRRPDGQGPRRAREGPARPPGEGAGRRRGREPDQARHARRTPRRTSRAASSSARRRSRSRTSCSCDPEGGKPTRVGVRVEGGERVRYAKKSGATIAAVRPRRGSKTMTARLLDKYKKDVIPVLKKEFGIENPMAVPKIEKVVLNMGIGEAITNAKLVDAAAEELTKIAGQRAVVTKAKKSIATVQAPRRDADRLPRDAARRADVRVPRPAPERRAPARPRLPRRADARLRRPRATTRSASRTTSSSPRSTRPRSTSPRDSTSRSSRRPARTTGPGCSSGSSACRSGDRARSDRRWLVAPQSSRRTRS